MQVAKIKHVCHKPSFTFIHADLQTISIPSRSI